MSYRTTRCLVALAGAAAIAASFSATAQTARPGDRAVEDLIEQTEKSAQQFERALDKDLKRATLRGAGGEVDMEAFLDDFETSIERLKERFDAKYAASTELNAVMRQAGDLDKFIQSQPPSLKGRSEWDVFKASLQSLAAAYGSTFPVDETKPPRRMNDLEIQQAADAAIDNGSKLRRELSSVFGKDDKQNIKTAQDDIEALSKAAKGLKARVDDGKPASGEAVVFVDAVSKLRATLGDRPLPGDAKTANDGISAAVAKIEQAFNIPAAKTPTSEPPAATTSATAAPAEAAPATT